MDSGGDAFFICVWASRLTLFVNIRSVNWARMAFLTCSEGGGSIVLLHGTAIGRGRRQVLGEGSILKFSVLLDAFGKIEEADFDFNFNFGLSVNGVSPHVDGTRNPPPDLGEHHILESSISNLRLPPPLFSFSLAQTLVP